MPFCLLSCPHPRPALFSPQSPLSRSGLLFLCLKPSVPPPPPSPHHAFRSSPSPSGLSRSWPWLASLCSVCFLLCSGAPSPHRLDGSAFCKAWLPSSAACAVAHPWNSLSPSPAPEFLKYLKSICKNKVMVINVFQRRGGSYALA